jgi:hypothetical protein
MTENLLSIPSEAGRAIVEAGNIIACPLLGTDGFVSFCKERGLSVDRERLLGLERLGLFAPIFRVQDPDELAQAFTIPIREGNNWFEAGWAWDTTSVGSTHRIPDLEDQTQEGYYSIFQLDYLDVVLSSMTLHVRLDSYLDCTGDQDVNWSDSGNRWIGSAVDAATNLRTHEYRRSKGLLCQFIADRYYPHTQGDLRTIRLSRGHFSDRWINVHARDWDWYEVAQAGILILWSASFNLHRKNFVTPMKDWPVGRHIATRWSAGTNSPNLSRSANGKD